MINKEVRNILLIGITATAVSAAVCFFFAKSGACAVVCLVLGAILVFTSLKLKSDRYKKLSELNMYLSRICTGEYNLDIMDNEEGELSILKNNLYKVTILLRSQNELLKKDKLYLADSLADISHQLKTPLTSMMVMTDLLKEEQDEEKRDEFIKIIETQLDKMKWLILNLLKLSKLDSGTIEFNREDISICFLVEQSLKPLLVTAELKNIEIINELSDFTIQADRNWTVEAFENIIKNCIEHSEKGSTIALDTQVTNVYKSLIIRDNGSGIDKEDLQHIFERFYRGKNSANDSVGIGLALSKTIIEKENGKIFVKSEIGSGTEFEIRFYNSII